jgi:hypothetical protein
MAASLETGSKHVLSYFVATDGTCNLTLMIAETNSIEAGDWTASRVKILIEPEKSSRFDVADGKSLEFFCGTGAMTMLISPLDRVAVFREGKIIP